MFTDRCYVCALNTFQSCDHKVSAHLDSNREILSRRQYFRNMHFTLMRQVITPHATSCGGYHENL